MVLGKTESFNPVFFRSFGFTTRFFCHRDTNTRACYDLPQAYLPEKAFSHAKGFSLLPAVIKMEMCKQRLDTNNSVMSLLCVC